MTAEATLAPLRAQIDAIDAAMVDLLARRFGIVQAVVARKARAGVAARLDDRVEAVVAHVREKAGAAGCPPDLADHVWRAMIEWIIGYEERQLAGLAAHPDVAGGESGDTPQDASAAQGDKPAAEAAPPEARPSPRPHGA